jgi:hypothetical protein
LNPLILGQFLTSRIRSVDGEPTALAELSQNLGVSPQTLRSLFYG